MLVPHHIVAPQPDSQAAFPKVQTWLPPRRTHPQLLVETLRPRLQWPIVLQLVTGRSSRALENHDMVLFASLFAVPLFPISILVLDRVSSLTCFR
jgi:hypothetical protein